MPARPSPARSGRALGLARELAAALGCRAVEIADADRTAYHAAASIASNFLITLECAAERLAATTGADRELLLPLVRATVENWATLGPERALTGPVARGDEATVARQRAAVSERAAELLPLFDALADATRALAADRVPAERAAGEPAGRATAARSGRADRGRSAGMRVVRTITEVRAALAEPRRAGEHDRPRSDHGGLSRGSPVADAPGSRRMRRTSSCPCSSTPRSSTSRAISAPTPAMRRATPRWPPKQGVELLFAPAVEELYPVGFATTVSVAGLTDGLEGVYRGRAHFDGVATIVTKLLNIVAPQVAYFGQKDAQQALVIKRFVRDLDIPTRIEVSPTVREPDGLAMSSRNARLDAEERDRAAALYRALRSAEAAVAAGERDPAAVRARARAELDGASVEPEYLELVSAADLGAGDGDRRRGARRARRPGREHTTDRQPP